MSLIRSWKEMRAGQALIQAEAIALEESIHQVRLAHMLGMLEGADAVGADVIELDDGVLAVAELRAAVARIPVDSEYMTNALAIKARLYQMAVDMSQDAPPNVSPAAVLLRIFEDLAMELIRGLEARQAQLVSS
jgi:hypothetical protein